MLINEDSSKPFLIGTGHISHVLSSILVVEHYAFLWHGQEK